MTAYEASLLARARDLADEAAELGDAVAVTILGGARAAGLDPAAYAPLTGAALALGADRVTVYRAGAPACPTDAAFLAAVADAEDDARDLLAAAGALAETVTAALDAALADADDAADAAEAAEDDKDAGDAAERAALCEEALGVLGELDTRLRHAIARLQAVPVVLGETYESVYALIRSGGRMPLEGRWVTGDDRAVTWPAVPAMTGRRTGPVLAALPGYLAGHGWTREPDRRGAQVWRLRDLARVLVPPPGFEDSGDLAAIAVCAIARTERRRPRDVLRAVTAGAGR
jgi:hypothetical protein